MIGRLVVAATFGGLVGQSVVDANDRLAIVRDERIQYAPLHTCPVCVRGRPCRDQKLYTAIEIRHVVGEDLGNVAWAAVVTCDERALDRSVFKMVVGETDDQRFGEATRIQEMMFESVVPIARDRVHV